MHELHCHDSVDQPYEVVRGVLVGNADELFRRATSDGSLSHLHVHIGVVDLAAEIEIEVQHIDEHPSRSHPNTTFALNWHSKRGETLFPTMAATFSISPLTSMETQIELTGTYAPPVNLVGEKLEATEMQRLAESSFASFIREIATYLRATVRAVQVA